MGISNPEIKKLYGLAAGRCSICKINVFDNEVHIGEMAHIIAKSSGGARGNEEIVRNRNSYENLILLCANHHTEVDQNPSCYTVERLHKIKSEHESTIASHFESPNERVGDISFLKLFMRFVPFIQLRYFTENLPVSVNLKLCTVGDMFEAGLVDNPHLYPLNDTNLQAHFQLFIEGYYELWNIISGFTNVDGRQQANFSQADDRGYLHMERRCLPYEKVKKLNESLDVKKSNFISAYSALIDFIRRNYKEVDLGSYEPYKI